MAKLYSCGDETNSLVLFPLMVSPHNSKDLTQSEQKSLKQNQKEETWWPGESTELNEKVKEIRQKFSKAVASQNRSGSDEFWDSLVALWGATASFEQLPFGVQSDEKGGTSLNAEEPDGGVESEHAHTPTHTSDAQPHGDADVDQDAGTPRTTKRKAPGNVVPQLIDNKRNI